MQYDRLSQQQLSVLFLTRGVYSIFYPQGGTYVTTVCTNHKLAYRHSWRPELCLLSV